MICHHVSFDDFYSFVLAQRLDDIPQVCPILIVDRFPAVLGGKHDVILAHPLPYGKTYTKDDIIKAAREIYADNAKLLEAAMKTLGQ